MLRKLYLILVPLSLPTTALHLRRRIYDPYITCPGSPPTHADGLPQAYSETTYSNSLALCSAAHGARQNVGCMCTSSGGQVHCDEQIADLDLFHAVVLDEGKTIADFCKGLGCYCRTIGEAVQALNDTPRTTSVMNPQYDPAGPNPFRDVANTASWQDGDQCGVGCRTDEDCQSCATNHNAADAYSCRAAQQSKFNPSSGAATFVSMCLITGAMSGMNGKGGKRDVGLPCPCNGTYISPTCCGVKGGLVWEPAGFNLGELVSGDGL